MKKFWSIGLFLGLILCPMFYSYGQVHLKLEFQKRIYLQNETVVAKVSLRNDSGQNLAFGSDEQLKGGLKFEIVDRSKGVAKSIAAGNIMEGLILESGKTQDIYVKLNQHYDLSRENRYNVKAYIEHPMLEKSYESNIKVMEVSKGVVEWRRKVGLPSFMRESVEPDAERSRQYKILSLMNQGRKNIYVSLEDTVYLYAMYHLCVMLGSETFQAEVDHLGRLHILAPYAPKEFRYFVVTLDGDLETDAFYRSTSTTPIMARDAGSGRVYLVGGEEYSPEE